jgi:hypothetical protein
MIFLGWYDDTPKKSIADKILDGAVAYTMHFKAWPNICVCSPANVAAVDGRVDDDIDVGTSLDNKPPWIGTANLFLLGRVESGETLGDYRQARGALHSGDDTPSEVVIRRMRDEE